MLQRLHLQIAAGQHFKVKVSTLSPRVMAKEPL